MDTTLIKTLLTAAASLVAAIGQRSSLRQEVDALKQIVSTQQELITQLSNQMIADQLSKFAK